MLSIVPTKLLSIIIFKFIDKETQRSYDRAGRRSLSLMIYVYENFDWDKPQATRLQWTKEDAERLGNLTIARIGIVGEHLGDNPPAIF